MSLSDDVNSLVKTKKIKQKLSALPEQKQIDSVKGVSSDDEIVSMTITPPLTFTMLTYDDTADHTEGSTVFKTVATGICTDAEGREFPFNVDPYPEP